MELNYPMVDSEFNNLMNMVDVFRDGKARVPARKPRVGARGCARAVGARVRTQAACCAHA